MIIKNVIEYDFRTNRKIIDQSVISLKIDRIVCSRITQSKENVVENFFFV